MGSCTTAARRKSKKNLARLQPWCRITFEYSSEEPET
jgi:hypothetical protein